ncbi:adenylate/guanylate cyclase domain-containing protein [Roseibium sp.]|uniref:adenylate/guanylate cyclase domain-containing protein n=1 Tax=Roseibium sp. TaxID=1936156 RepID=UPI003D0C8D4C
MAEKLSKIGSGALGADYEEALALSGLVDGVSEPLLLEPHPYRYAEGEFICRPGDPARCLWIIVNGSVAVKQDDQTLFVRRRNEVIGEQHLVGNGYQRIYGLVANESNVEVLVVDKEKIETHPEAGVIWRNIAKIISLKLRNATKKTASLGRQLADDTRILHAYTNQYALSRKMQAGGDHQTEYMVERAVIWFSDVVDFSKYTLKTSPDLIADVMQRFFNAQSAPIVERGGHIDKFIGDGLMAFWVLPGTGQDTKKICMDAVQAAEQATRDVGAIMIGNSPLSLRVGLHVGLVISGDFGSATRHQFTLIGTEVNKAARLEQIHSEEIVEGEGSLGSVRMSRELWSELSSPLQRRFRNRFLVRAKNIGETEVFTD